MKRYILLFLFIFSISVQICAEKEDVPLSIIIDGDYRPDTAYKRSLMKLPIQVSFDEESRTFEIGADIELDALVYLTDERGDILAQSPCINSILIVPSDLRGIIIIRIESKLWKAVGEVNI